MVSKMTFNQFRYGLALRDHDIDVIKNRNALVNRYPLMDVRSIFI